MVALLQDALSLSSTVVVPVLLARRSFLDCIITNSCCCCSSALIPTISTTTPFLTLTTINNHDNEKRKTTTSTITETPATAETTQTTCSLSWEETIDLICHCTPQVFRQAIHASGGHFLYRGEEKEENENENENENEEQRRMYQMMMMTTTTTTATRTKQHETNTNSCPGSRIVYPTPDLLVPGTYPDPDAIRYFQALEKQLSSTTIAPAAAAKTTTTTTKLMALPSTGHIGISNIMEASQWGPVVSVWPLGTSLSYVWPQNRQLFFPNNHPQQQQPQQDDMMINQGLTKALEIGREILFASSFDESSLSSLSSLSSAFVTVPSSLDDEIRKRIFNHARN